jgi:N utilization substance protein B
MLNRRHLRIKVLQVLYAFIQSDNKDLSSGEKELFAGIEKVFDLYCIFLSVIGKVAETIDAEQEQARNKKLPTYEDLNPDKRFINNYITRAISESEILQREIKNRKLIWAHDSEIIKKIYRAFVASDAYKQYLSAAPSEEADLQAILSLLEEYIVNFEALEYFLEERTIYWHDDFEAAAVAAMKSIRLLSNKKPLLTLASLYKDEKDDIAFVRQLFRMAVLHNDELQEMVAQKTKNWEIDRVALMDIILMKMALTEFLYMDEIPLKVSLNEYIEISKTYSTPKSRLFINGVLDKLVIELKEAGKIQKKGRGLIE